MPDTNAQILLIDDNPTQLKVREMVLRGAGFMVSVATNAGSALALMKTAGDHYRAVVTDHMLEGHTGVDFLRELRSFNSEIPVVVLTGMPDIEGEYDGLNAMVRQKPLPPGELIALVQQTIADNIH